LHTPYVRTTLGPHTVPEPLGDSRYVAT